MSIVSITRHGAVAILTLDRPEAMNALGHAGDGDAIYAACTELDADHSIHAVVFTGAGRAFSAGGDVKAMADPDSAFNAAPMPARDHYRHNIHRALRAIAALNVPVIAAVNGPAIGLGCDLACLADIRIASDRARFGVTFLKLGLIPGDGGAWLLPRIIGDSRAAELFFTGDLIDANTALDWGLISRVVPADDLMSEALALAQRIAAMPPHALRVTKTLLRHGRGTSYDTALEMAADAQVTAQITADFREGVAAIIEKRTAVFQGT